MLVTNDCECTVICFRLKLLVTKYMGTSAIAACRPRAVGWGRRFMFLFLLFVLIVVQGLREYRLEMTLKTERMRHQKSDDSPRVPA